MQTIVEALNHLATSFNYDGGNRIYQDRYSHTNKRTIDCNSSQHSQLAETKKNNEQLAQE